MKFLICAVAAATSPVMHLTGAGVRRRQRIQQCGERKSPKSREFHAEQWDVPVTRKNRVYE